MPADLVVAQYANTRGSRVNDPDLDRYLLDEYPGGMTVEALLAGTFRPQSGVRTALLPFLTAQLQAPARSTPAHAPESPPSVPPTRTGPQELPDGRGRDHERP